MRINRISKPSRMTSVIATLSATALVLAGCSSESGDDAAGDNAGGEGASESYSIGINQLVQHPALDASAAGFKAAFEDAGVEVEWDEQNANGEQSTAVTIAQQMANADHDLYLAIATPAAQAMAQSIKDAPLLFTAVTDPEAAELVDSNDAPGANVTGTSDIAPISDQVDLLKELVPDAKTIGVVYASGEVNSQVQVDELTSVAGDSDIDVKSQTVTSVTEIPQAVQALDDVDAIYVPTDNMVVSGIASLINVANESRFQSSALRPAPLKVALLQRVLTTPSLDARPVRWRCASCKTAKSQRLRLWNPRRNLPTSSTQKLLRRRALRFQKRFWKKLKPYDRCS